MTEYWVSQGNKWCDFCKIFLSNNPSTVRNHELGQRHKDNVAQRLADMRKANAAKEKEQKEAVRTLEQIEANPLRKAKRSYQKDIANFRDARDSHELPVEVQENGEKWEFDSTSGYYYNEGNGFYYDSNSGFYYSDAIGKWVTQEEAHASPQFFLSNSKHKKPALETPSSTSSRSVIKDKIADIGERGPPPGKIVSASLNPMRSVKGAASSVVVGKRKRPNERQKVISEEEKAALKAREAAKKRVEEREKPLLGLYSHRLP